MSEAMSLSQWREGNLPAQLLTKDDLAAFRTQLFQEIRNLLQQQEHTGITKKWMKSSEVQKLLNISRGKLLSLRISGKLPFTRVGGLIYYSGDDIKDMLESNKQQY
jgi:hypothetical protein